MVGRGPTGAGVLVLSVLIIILTAEGSGAQKGWWRWRRRERGGDTRRRAAAMRGFESLNSGRFRGVFSGELREARSLCCCPAEVELPHAAERRRSSAWFTPPDTARHDVLEARV